MTVAMSSLQIADDVDASPCERAPAAGERSRDHTFDTQPSPNLALRARERQQVLDDLGGAIGFAINQPQIAAEVTGLFRSRALWRRRHEKQLDVSEHALQRIVYLVRDAGDELSERRQLLGLCQTRPQSLALGFEPRLFRDVACDEHGADLIAVLIDERRHRHDKVSAERIVLASTRALDCHVAVADRCPFRKIAAHELL